VNSSAPATTTRIKPSEKAIPASHLVGPRPRVDPEATVVDRTAASAMKCSGDEREHERRDRQGRRFRHVTRFHQGGDLAGREGIVAGHRVWVGGSAHRDIMAHRCS
jgi:hypothetical protein